MSASMNKVLLGHNHLICISLTCHLRLHLSYKAELNSGKRDLKAQKPNISTLALHPKKKKKKAQKG